MIIRLDTHVGTLLIALIEDQFIILKDKYVRTVFKENWFSKLCCCPHIGELVG